MLTRKLIESGAYLDHFRGLDPAICWDDERQARSIAETMAAAPARDADIWVFGYGSLIWNPMLCFDERHWATLPGWRRSFSLGMVAGRGSPEHPGRMLGVQPGGSLRGVALRVSGTHVQDELRLLWRREMPTGAYLPTWEKAVLDDGRQVTSLVFAANANHPMHAQDSSVATVAPLVAMASGPYGSNAEYVLRLDDELAAAKAADAYVHALASAVKTLLR
ncbi:MAG TPA: gamma-glutamylcyclotransferase [Luteibacter sp.]|uniref:gamma-glutamylcyclotransferase n=1 Tax=Luteibacter sp. TaxID=1886636 RepID=UPI002CEAC757|nr:gamma-glutamylcyclotransferase [Luteibacter sp.]HVI54531.1 gamma-glutamylcyclotransferase [Luteibacter sp.]